MSHHDRAATARPTPSSAGDRPVLSREVIRELRRPFEPGAVKPKIQAQGPKDPAPKEWAQIVYYIDARSVIERLNHLLGADWHDRYEVVDSSDGQLEVLCRLTVCGVTREDIGTGSDRKAAYSDALKRAAVHFGVGVSVYAMPRLFMRHGDGPGELRRNRAGRLTINDQAERHLAARYRAWLERHGTRVYGEALGHGDPVDAVGDFETETPDVTPDPANHQGGGQAPAEQPRRPRAAGGPLQPADTDQAPHRAPASPQERARTAEFARAAGLSLPTVKALAELVCGSGMVDRLDEQQNKQLYETVVTAVQAGLGDAQLGEVIAKSLARPDRAATREAFLAWLCQREEQAVAKTFGAERAA